MSHGPQNYQFNISNQEKKIQVKKTDNIEF